MTWHYQAIRHIDDGEPWIGIHEYYDLDDGPSWTVEPVRIMGDCLDDIKWEFKRILQDIERYGIIDYPHETATQQDP